MSREEYFEFVRKIISSNMRLRVVLLFWPEFRNVLLVPVFLWAVSGDFLFRWIYFSPVKPVRVVFRGDFVL